MSTRRPPERSIVWESAEDLAFANAVSDGWIAAIHEAGHAVIALRVGYELRDVMIANAYKCRVWLELPQDEPPAGMSTPSMFEAECDALYTLAGGVAEALRPEGDGTAHLDGWDREHFDSLGPDPATRETKVEWRDRMRAITERVVLKNWSSIEAVARALLERKRLTAAEVAKLVP
ncbi:MAG: hypothetical protein ACREXU_05680, partial [Gammaproteobacteria bacterium]